MRVRTAASGRGTGLALMAVLPHGAGLRGPHRACYRAATAAGYDPVVTRTGSTHAVARKTTKAPARRRVPPGLGSLNRTWHLAHDQHEIELTEFEYAALRMNAAFERWNEAAIRAAGEPSLTYSEASILHVIRMQERPKRISVIANLLNRDDIGNLQYSLRKLRSLGLIRPAGTRSRKNFEYEVTARGRDVTDRVAEIAGELIFASTRELASVNDKLAAAAGLLRLMTGILDEAARVAATFVPAMPVAAPKRRRKDPGGA